MKGGLRQICRNLCVAQIGVESTWSLGESNNVAIFPSPFKVQFFDVEGFSLNMQAMVLG